MRVSDVHELDYERKMLGREAGSRIWQCLKIVKSRQRLEMSVCAEVGARIEKQVSVFVQDPSLVHTN